MTFNSRSYYRNKAKRSALAELAAARDIKARTAAGAAYGWEAARIPHMVKIARLNWRSYLSYRRLDIMDADMRAMPPRDFIAKYGAAK